MTPTEADKEAHTAKARFELAKEAYDEARKVMNFREMEWMKALQRRREAER